MLRAALMATPEPGGDLRELVSDGLGLAVALAPGAAPPIFMARSDCVILASAIDLGAGARVVMTEAERSARAAATAIALEDREAALRRSAGQEVLGVEGRGISDKRLLHVWAAQPEAEGTESPNAAVAWLASFGEAPVRVDAAGRGDSASWLVRDLATLDELSRVTPTGDDLQYMRLLAPARNRLHEAAGALVLPAGRDEDAAFRKLAYQLADRERAFREAQARAVADPWADFEARSARYLSQLARLGPGGWVDDGTAKDLVIARTDCRKLAKALDVLAGASQRTDEARAAAYKAGTKLRWIETDRLLAEMPVVRIKDASGGRIRVAPMEDAGIRSVLDVLRWGSPLEAIPGVGEASAARAESAARSIRQTTYEETPVRIDVTQRSQHATQLLAKLAAWDALRRASPSAAAKEALASLSPLRGGFSTADAARVLPLRPGAVDTFEQASAALLAAAESVLEASTRASSAVPSDAWADFLDRPADYFTMLAELGLAAEDEEHSHGDLPDEIVQAIRRHELHTDHLTASLRGYQAFAAKFALVQRKVIIGDEMGLGKTVEALAVLAHLHAKGHSHFLVVCPAAVVTNWTREVAGKSTLRAHRLHGQGRDWAVRNWVRGGGVAVTTYDSLGWFEGLPDSMDLACVVVDEAHYIKNPNALRTERTVELIDGCRRAILMTGTPLENRVEEFRNLASYVRPDLVVDAEGFAPKRFRRQIAPAYLRRNQEDVLTELPGLVEVEEWLPLSSADRATYEGAVLEGNFMAMRQAAMLAGLRSQKVDRLLEIIAESQLNGRRVIVFSYFREVLSRVQGLIEGPVFGPITGAVAPAARQTMVDAFSRAAGGAVLLAQIVAGGQGLNIQAASVVVICEPQLKPTLEAQAIARAHRMGQVQSVQVHRLLSEEGVDARIVEILAEKRLLFDEFARKSEMVGAAPEALDVTEAALARQVVAEERERLARAGNEQQELG